MQQKKTFINKYFIYMVFLTGLISAVLGIFMVSSYEVLENEMKDSSSAFLKIYSNEFENTVSELNGILKSIASQKLELAKMKNEDEKEHLLASVSLYNYLKTISSNMVADAMIVYDENNDICLDRISSNVSYHEKLDIRDHTISSLNKDSVESGRWNFLQLGNKTYLYKILKSNGQAIAVYVQSEQLLKALAEEQNGNRYIVLANKNGLIGKVWGDETEEIRIGNNVSRIDSNNYYRLQKDVVEDQLVIYCFKSKSDIFQQIHTGMIVVSITAGAALLFMIFLLRYTRKEILVPMKIMIQDMQRIKAGEYDNRVDEDFSTKEFQMLKDTTNQMIDEILGLKIQSYEKKLELQDMELKSIRLQLKPHFFLNALTTISSLSSQNKNEQIKRFIDALSKNVRYMFRAGFHTVTVKEEIRHVISYFEMQELKYPDCIFYLVDLPKELEEWMIPQMLIHTFIENEYKYAVSVDETLTILIKISKVCKDEADMLLIEIEDDGKGYPQEVLDYMNGKTKRTSESGERIGLWSIKSMMELMYEKKGLVQLDNITPHGCLNKIYIPGQAAHELADTNEMTERI